MRSHADQRAPKPIEETGEAAMPGSDGAGEAAREIERVVAERSQLLARKHNEQNLSPGDHERLDLLTTRLRQLLPPVSIRDREVLLDMAEVVERIRDRASERRRRLGLG
jgi:hypothetical protein